MSTAPGSQTADNSAPQNQSSRHRNFLHRLTNSTTAKAAITALLVLLMLIPMGMVNSVVAERGYRYQGVLAELAGVWGEEQTLSGPILSVPYTQTIITDEEFRDDKGTKRTRKKTTKRERTAYFLARDVKINSTIDEEYRSRSIFRSLVYKVDVEITAEFNTPDLHSLSNDISEIHWQKSFFSVGISDTGAINNVANFSWGDQALHLSSGTKLKTVPMGFHATLGEAHGFMPDAESQPTETSEQTQQLKISFSINGSGGFYFTPHGERTLVSLQSPWPHPSFRGDTLPVSRTISADGFKANWDISHLARNYSQSWTDNQHPQLYELTAGVSMFEPDSLYTRITRAAKYGILFIGLTFLTLFIFEVSIARNIHLMQYALIGASLSLFYLLLLSLSEHISFVYSYTAASATCITMISVYTGYVLKSRTRGLFIALLLCGLYALLFSLLRLEDYALLVGTFILSAVVVVLMVVTRNLNHSAV